MTSTWSIQSATHKVSNGGIIRTEWRIDATSNDNNFKANRSGWCDFTPDPSSPSFVPYDDVTQANVLDWCYEQINKDEIEADVEAEIEALKNPTEASGFPWDEDDGE